MINLHLAAAFKFPFIYSRKKVPFFMDYIIHFCFHTEFVNFFTIFYKHFTTFHTNRVEKIYLPLLARRTRAALAAYFLSASVCIKKLSTSALNFLLISLLLTILCNTALCKLCKCLKALRVIDCHLCKHFSVNFNTGSLQTVHHLAVR